MIRENRGEGLWYSPLFKRWKTNNNHNVSSWATITWFSCVWFQVDNKLQPGYTYSHISAIQFTRNMFLKTFEARNRKCSNRVLIHI